MKNLKNSILEALDMNVPEMGIHAQTIVDKIACYIDMEDYDVTKQFMEEVCTELDKKVKAPVIKKVFGVTDKHEQEIYMNIIGIFTSTLTGIDDYEDRYEKQPDDVLRFIENTAEIHNKDWADVDNDIYEHIVDNYDDFDSDQISTMIQNVHKNWNNLCHTVLRVLWAS